MNQPSTAGLSPTAEEAAVKAAIETTTIFYQVLIYLDAFNTEFLQWVMTTLLQTDERANCFLVPYNRAVLDVRSLIALNNVSHFQAVTMLARALFELAVEIRLINVIPDAVPKMVIFHQLEKFKAALKAIKFASNHTLQFPVDLSPYQQFIASNGAGIIANATALWGSDKVKHWSAKDLAQRAKALSPPYEEIYESLYKQLSWQVHKGLAGAVNMRPETFAYLYGISCQIAALSYEQILNAVIIEFKLSSAKPTILKELEFAKLRAGAENQEQEAAIRRGLGLT